MNNLGKIICFTIALMFITSVTGCRSGTNITPGTTLATTTPGTAAITTVPGTTATTGTGTVPGTTGAIGITTYKDGTYTGAGDPWANGAEDATVTIKGGKIESVVLRRLDKAGKEVDYNIFAGETKDGKTYPNLKKFREDMAKEMVSRQTYNVDTITGATESTKNWKVAVQRALDKAK